MKNLTKQIVLSLKEEKKTIGHLGFSRNEKLQHLDDLVTSFLMERGIDNDEDSICEKLGFDDYHAIRDAQSVEHGQTGNTNAQKHTEASTATIQCRLPPSLKRKIESVAQSKDMKLCEFVRKAIEEKIKKDKSFNLNKTGE